MPELPRAFMDLHRLSEDERIAVIGEFCLANPARRVAVPTDDEQGKAERYKRKLEERYPQLRVELAGPLMKGVVLLRVTCMPEG